MLGIKHLVECHCTLQIFKGRDDHLYHKFPVYSKMDSNGKVIQKYVQCNNCKTIHSVYDICKSDIVRGGKDSLSGAVTIEDISFQLPTKITNVLTRYECDISTWEQVLDMYDNEIWNIPIVVAREIVDLNTTVKIFTLLDKEKIKITSETIEDNIEVEK